MRPSLARQIWVACKIWLLAVITNTVLGSIYLSYELTGVTMMGYIVIYGFLFGAVCSFPVMVLLAFIINRSVVKEKSGLWIFRLVFISGLVATLGVWYFFDASEFFAKSNLGLMFISLLSGMTGIAMQYKSLYKLGERDKAIEQFLETPVQNNPYKK